MGLKINRNEEYQYQLISTISDEKYHDEEWVSEDEAKRILITRKIWDFIEDIVEIDIAFPDTYRINGEIKELGKFTQWWLDNEDITHDDDKLGDLVDSIFERLDLKLGIGLTDTNEDTEKKYWRVGFSYYPNEQVDRTEVMVRGTKEEAITYLKEVLIPSYPDWVVNQITMEFDTMSRTGLFIYESKVVELPTG